MFVLYISFTKLHRNFIQAVKSINDVLAVSPSSHSHIRLCPHYQKTYLPSCCVEGECESEEQIDDSPTVPENKSGEIETSAFPPLKLVPAEAGIKCLCKTWVVYLNFKTIT